MVFLFFCVFLPFFPFVTEKDEKIRFSDRKMISNCKRHAAELSPVQNTQQTWQEQRYKMDQVINMNKKAIIDNTLNIITMERQCLLSQGNNRSILCQKCFYTWADFLLNTCFMTAEKEDLKKNT